MKEEFQHDTVAAYNFSTNLEVFGIFLIFSAPILVCYETLNLIFQKPMLGPNLQNDD